MVARGIIPKFLVGYPNTKKYRTLLTQNISTKEDVYKILGEIQKEL